MDTRRAHGLAASLLRRHGVLTRPAAAAEGIPGGFAAVYPVLKAMEDAGKCRRGYFVEGLGGAQFALPGAVDRMRSFTDEGRADPVVLAAADPANPYGAALQWPGSRTGEGHRPGRKAGASVVLVGGNLVFYLEKGGRSMLSFSDDEAAQRYAAGALAAAAGSGLLGTLHIQRIGGESVIGGPVAEYLEAAGGRPSSRGVRFRPGVSA
jgi:ATP-dependent Lhr-like helicase